jgi:RNase P/RNase MRP subunit POP5
MLRRRNKRRYLAVLYDPNTSQTEVKGDIQRRFTELFGSLATELTYLRAYHSRHSGILILGCDLEYLERILFTIAMMEQPMTAVMMSGTIRKLRERLDSKWNPSKLNA